MLFLPPKYEFSLSTKFYEYVSKNKKIIVISYDGSTPDLIINNQLGYVVNPQNMYKDLENALCKLSALKDNTSSEFDLEKYSVETLAKTVRLYLK